MAEKVKLAEALLRRKELAGKVAQLAAIKDRDVYDVVSTRKLAHEGIDDVIAKVPKLTASEVTAEFDYYAKQLRLIDAVIQQANWTVEVEVDSMLDYTQPTKTVIGTD